ncbi:MAG: hypothetical protein IJ379_11930 [Lachnospiraceae bacterium]|nr:hypothetical protein [Lachnospiraceae bacterium]
MRREIKERSLSDRIAKDAVFVLITVLLVLGLALFVSETVMSQTEGNISVDEKHIRMLEQEYVGEIRDYLEEQGFANSGVTLTKVSEADGTTNYKVLLHHKGIDKLSQNEHMELFAAVEALAFQVAGCEFQVNLLV